MKLILELLIILGLTVVAFFMFIVLCTFLSCFLKKAKKKYYSKINTTIKQKTENKCLNQTIKFYNQCKNFVLLHKPIVRTILFIFIALGVPIAVQNNQMNIGTEFKKYIKIGTPRDWFGFWSSYIGSVASILFAYFNTKWQISLLKYENDAKKLNDLKNKNEKYTNVIYDYQQELTNIKKSPKKERDQKLQDFYFKYEEDRKNYSKIYNKMLSEISSLNYWKVEKIFQDYSFNSLSFINALNALLGSPNEKNWNEAIKQTEEIYIDFSKLSEKVNTLCSEFRSKS